MTFYFTTFKDLVELLEAKDTPDIIMFAHSSMSSIIMNDM